MGIHFDRGQALFDLRRYGEAIREYQGELADNPQCAASQANIAAALINLGRQLEARHALGLALGINPEHAHAHYLRSYVEPFEEAKSAVKEAIRLSPSAEYWCRLGILLHQQSRYAEANAAFDQALASDPRHVEALACKADTLHQVNRTDESLRIIQSARAIAPNDSLVHRSMGSISLDAGNPSDALTGYEESRRLNPLQDELSTNIAKAYGAHIWPFSALNKLRSRYLRLHALGRWLLQAIGASAIVLIVQSSNPQTSPHWSTPVAIALLILLNGVFAIFLSQAYAQAIGMIGARRINRMSWIVAATAALKQLALIAIIHWMVSIVALVLVVYPAMTYFALAVSLAFVVWITVYVAAASFIIFVVALSTAFLIAGYGASQFFESPIVALICWLAILAHSGLGNFLLYRIETLQTLR